MPHLIINYSKNLDAMLDMTGFCRAVCDALLVLRDEQGNPLFPIGGTRVLAFPAAHYAIADGQRDYAFAYMNLRMAKGRSEGIRQQVGETISGVVNALIVPLFDKHYIGVTVQVDEGHEVYDAKISSIHPLFKKPVV